MYKIWEATHICLACHGWGIQLSLINGFGYIVASFWFYVFRYGVPTPEVGEAENLPGSQGQHSSTATSSSLHTVSLKIRWSPFASPVGGRLGHLLCLPCPSAPPQKKSWSQHFMHACNGLAQSLLCLCIQASIFLIKTPLILLPLWWINVLVCGHLLLHKHKYQRRMDCLSITLGTFLSSPCSSS